MLLVPSAEAMNHRDGWKYSYLMASGELLGCVKDGLLRKHLPMLLSLFKNGGRRRSDAVVVLTVK